jgi:hypothetical protein
VPANVETYREDDRWKNRVLGNKRASNTFDTKAEAQAKGREMAQKLRSEHIIKKRDGSIGERNSYGNDPYPPKG